ncbi:putative pectin lyase/virulence factor [Helianthus debilis subsp. tardiflorus]
MQKVNLLLVFACLNCEEAVNFAPADWLPYAGSGAERYRHYRRPAVLSHEQLLYGVVKVYDFTSIIWDLGTNSVGQLKYTRPYLIELNQYIADSCTNTRIEDCYIVSGDDCVAVKSGWDEYGIAYGMPTQQFVVRWLTCISPTSAVIALGSEMSGGIQDV